MIRIDHPEQIGNVLAALRTMHQLTRTQLAAEIGMGEQQYGRYEIGRNAPSLATLLRLVAYHGYRLALVPDDEPATPERKTA